MRTGPSHSGLSCIAAAALFASVACVDTGPHPLGEAPLEIANGTTISVVLLVNGSVVRTVSPYSAEKMTPDQLPPLPWSVEARSPHSRTLVSLTVRPGDVRRTELPNGAVEYVSPGTRVDLSCGTIDIWSGTPMIGPLPGPGHPGDCD